MNDWMQRHGTQLVFVLALVFTLISTLLAKRAERLESHLRQGSVLVSAPIGQAQSFEPGR
jgi:hypothetical protein